MDLAEGESEDGTSTPAEKEAGMIPPTPTEEEAGTIPPNPTEKEAGTIWAAPNENEAGITSWKPSNPKKIGTPKRDWPATPRGKRCCADDDTEDEEYVSCFLEWLNLDPDCKRMLDDETNTLAHHERRMGSRAIPIVQQAVNEDLEVYMEVWTHITAVI